MENFPYSQKEKDDYYKVLNTQSNTKVSPYKKDFNSGHVRISN